MDQDAAHARRVPYLAGRRQGVTSYLDARLALYEARRDTHVQHGGFNAREKPRNQTHLRFEEEFSRKPTSKTRSKRKRTAMHVCPFSLHKKGEDKKNTNPEQKSKGVQPGPWTQDLPTARSSTSTERAPFSDPSAAAGRTMKPFSACCHGGPRVAPEVALISTARPPAESTVDCPGRRYVTRDDAKCSCSAGGKKQTAPS